MKLLNKLFGTQKDETELVENLNKHKPDNLRPEETRYTEVEPQ
jgi:hypothetical protein